MTSKPDNKEGGVAAPTRLPIEWRDDGFFDKKALEAEMERVFDICHGCRRCVNLCQSFPTLFDLVDESKTMEVDGVDKADYAKVVNECFLCDLCYMTKCPYVPPHEWNVDFPHLMLRAKAVATREKGPGLRDRLLSSTETFGRMAARVPGAAAALNLGLKSKMVRRRLGIHPDAEIPEFAAKSFRAGFHKLPPAGPATKAAKVALFVSCAGNYNAPGLVGKICDVLRHNGATVELPAREMCCGMPKLEQGDLDAVEKSMNCNVPVLHELVRDGFEIVAPIPSCVLMFKQELPLMFPDDARVREVGEHMHDPAGWLSMLHKRGEMNTDFKRPLGRVAYHAACHTRVQNIGLKTPALLNLVPDTTVTVVERCSGHDGTYAVKAECHDSAVKLARPVARKVAAAEPQYFTSDCMLAGRHIARFAETTWRHPMELLCIAYGLESDLSIKEGNNGQTEL